METRAVASDFQLAKWNGWLTLETFSSFLRLLFEMLNQDVLLLLHWSSLWFLRFFCLESFCCFVQSCLRMKLRRLKAILQREENCSQSQPKKFHHSQSSISVFSLSRSKLLLFPHVFSFDASAEFASLDFASRWDSSSSPFFLTAIIKSSFLDGKHRIRKVFHLFRPLVLLVSLR